MWIQDGGQGRGLREVTRDGRKSLMSSASDSHASARADLEQIMAICSPCPLGNGQGDDG